MFRFNCPSCGIDVEISNTVIYSSSDIFNEGFNIRIETLIKHKRVMEQTCVDFINSFMKEQTESQTKIVEKLSRK